MIKRNYEKHNYCGWYDKAFTKNVFRCPKCNKPLRSKPRHGKGREKYQGVVWY